ncbi:uncharacterized protein LOC128391055 [Panonychus citri]|uniref:uncharacterized protein LOC128391055 n=1 Tax=Panonychus citri TaxID=50023 RepID=UPI00230755AA|nr:uncharacterized protein LOC128391055 [Panonychus citri]
MKSVINMCWNSFTFFWIHSDSSRFQLIQLIFLHQLMCKLNYASSHHHHSSSTSSSSTFNPPHPRISPCNIPFFFLPTKLAIQPHIEPYEKVYRRAKAIKGCAKRVRKNFVQMLSDEDFETGLDNLRLNWLPEISNSIEDIAIIEEEDAFRRSFQYLQYFAIGLEQLVLDQALHEGHMIKEFREIEEKLSQLLCEVQLGMWYRNIKPDKRVGFEVMTIEYRDIADASRRMIRDYLLLRDLIKLTDYITQIFASLASRF